MVSVYHVAPHGSDESDGAEATPLRTISRAATLAHAGDTVIVHEGEYREWVKPARGGLSDQRRITYTAAPGERVVIKGSEQISNWEQLEDGNVWKATVPNQLFGDFNPYGQVIEGDWLVRPEADASARHLGDVYLNGRSFYEAPDLVSLQNPVVRTEILDDWTGVTTPVHDPDQTRFLWYAEVDADNTTIWANFQGADPNAELVEINVRRSVFYPTVHHLDYITVRGFEMAHAATPWAPPTADQPGLVGPNWAKGWIIEDNTIHDAKCSAISLGKEASTGHNYATERGDKPGYQYQLESVFAARHIGWDREHIGSHIVRRNTIFDCGQNAVVGHLGCVFSRIEDNHIYNIALKREFYGHEIAGIKLHAALDVIIEHNRIHDSSLGIWLDWQTQGTRVTRNLLYRNNRDLFIEVSHGPHLVDHNVLASPASLEVVSQGGAFVNNLVCGSVRLEPVMDRATPYHVPHSTQVAGFATISGGDDRYIGNIFLAGDLDTAYVPTGNHHPHSGYGTSGYDTYPASVEDFLANLDHSLGDHERFHAVKQAVTIHDNVYAGGARPYVQEDGALVVDEDTKARVTVLDEGREVYLEADLPDAVHEFSVPVVTGADLGRVRYPDAEFEDPAGNLVLVDRDISGTTKHIGENYPAGPFSTLSHGARRIRVW